MPAPLDEPSFQNEGNKVAVLESKQESMFWSGDQEVEIIFDFCCTTSDHNLKFFLFRVKSFFSSMESFYILKVSAYLAKGS